METEDVGEKKDSRETKDGRETEAVGETKDSREIKYFRKVRRCAKLHVEYFCVTRVFMKRKYHHHASAYC